MLCCITKKTRLLCFKKCITKVRFYFPCVVKTIAFKEISAVVSTSMVSSHSLKHKCHPIMWKQIGNTHSKYSGCWRALLILIMPKLKKVVFMHSLARVATTL